MTGPARFGENGAITYDMIRSTMASVSNSSLLSCRPGVSACR